MTQLPTGTVTFLFTDVEGSTRLLHDLGDDYVNALAEHRRVLREAFERRGGVEVDTQGDAFFVAFAKAFDALAAAKAGRDALADGPIRVRMGLHTGEPALTEEGYVGLDVHRAARIAAAGHGGQILVSQSTRDVAGGDGLRDLGEHRLKDLTAPERIYQLGDGEFPPLKSLNNSNLPLPMESLVGRKKELADARRAFRDGTRLFTITGPGGIGKTRFALQVATDQRDAFRDGAWWVGLAPVRDPKLVLPTIAAAVGAKTELENELRSKQVLLLLDNFEQVVDAAADLAALQSVCNAVVLLVTSREPLHVAGEREYPLPPLPEAPAVELLRQRAAAVAPDFEADYHELVELCNRLDGLPLAIELAAARAKSLSAAALLERLDQRLPMLTSRRRDVDERQKTLRATIEWSFELLDDDDQRTFVALSVFAGGFDLAAADGVCSAELDALESLVDKSLLRHTAEGRFFMLETIREYALEHLARASYESETRAGHALYYADVVRRSGAILELGAAAPEVFDRFEREHNNVRAALEYLHDRDHETFVDVVAGFWPFWWVRGHLDEGRRWLDTALARAEDGSASYYEVLEGAAHLAHVQGDQVHAHEFGETFLRVARARGDEREIGIALHLMANAAIASGAVDRGMALDEESLQHIDPKDRYARYPRSGLAYVAILRGDWERGVKLMTEVLEFDREVGDVEGIANDLGLLAIARAQLGEESDALRLMRESASVAAELGHTQVLSNRVLPAAAIILARKQEPGRALAALVAARSFADARGTGLGPLAEAVYDQVWKGTASSLAPNALAKISEDVARTLRAVDASSFVDEMLRSLD